MFIAIEGLRTHVERAGTGEPVLLLHGWGANAASLAGVMQSLSSSFAVWSLDFPGHGLTAVPPEPWGIGDFADFVRRAMDRLDLASAHLVGHSHGGRVSILLAARSPQLVRRLVLVDSAGIRPPRTLRLRLKGWTARSARRLLGHPLTGTPGKRALHAVYGKLGMADYRDAGPMRATFVRVVSEDLGPLLPQIKAPTLVVWGGRDRETPLWMGERMAEQIPNSHLTVIPEAGHYPFLDARQTFDAALVPFLRSDSL